MDMVMATGMAMRREPLFRTCFAWFAVVGSLSSVHAQTVAESDAGPKREWSITPRISMTETLTDNALLNNANKQSDQVTQISPGLRIDGEGARLKLHFDYARNEIFYANDTRSTNSQNSLNTFGTLEALEKWLYVDFNGVIAQQAISPFGTQSPSNVSVNSNQTETSNFRIAPYIRGKFSDLANYRVGYTRSTMHTKSGSASDVDTGEWSAQLNSSTTFRNFGWSLKASQQELDYSTGRRVETDQIRAVLSYQFDPQLKISVIGGREANNYVSPTKESHNTSGFGVDWSPSERTQLSAVKERRFFGDGHMLTFSHRTPLSALRFSDSRDVAALPNQLSTVGLGTYYDLFNDMLASKNLDPTQRAAILDQIFRLNPGISPNGVITTDFLNSSAYLQRRRDLSFALTGVRNTLTFVATQSESQRLAQSIGLNDIFTSTSFVRQRGFTVSLSHRLSALSTLSVAGSQLHSSGSEGSQDTTLRSLNASVSTKLGAHTSASLGARHAVFDSNTTPYTENAVVGTLTAQF